jgi:hypothetical protein
LTQSVAAPLPPFVETLNRVPYYPSNYSSTSNAVVGTFFSGLCFDKFTNNNCSAFLFSNSGQVDEFVSFNTSLADRYTPNVTFFDLMLGKALNSSEINLTLTTSILVNASSVGVVLALPADENGVPFADIGQFLGTMANLSLVPLQQFSQAWTPSNGSFVPFSPSQPSGIAPANMVLVPGTLGYSYISNASFSLPFLTPEALDVIGLQGIGTRYSWEAISAFNHSAVIDVVPFYLDVDLVTNVMFKAFLDESNYNSTITDSTNFLRHWITYANGTFSYNDTDVMKPVVWISKDDAEAFCRYYGKRLPTDIELQFATQFSIETGASDYRLFPWGNTTCSDLAPGSCPPVDSSPNPRLPDNVHSFPATDSSLQIHDLVGLAFQHTNSVFCDESACNEVLKGGCFYQLHDSRYFPSAASGDNVHYALLPLLGDFSSRSQFISFRCLVDTALQQQYWEE